MATVIKAEPYDLPFDPRTTALIIIDMQRDFLEPGGFGAAILRAKEELQPWSCRTINSLLSPI